MAYDIFELISTEETYDFTNTFTSKYKFFERFLPEVRSTAEYIRVTDYDIDYNPEAEVVGDNTVAPLAQRPSYDSVLQTLEVYKLKHELSDSEIRKIETASTNREKQEAERLVFNDAARLMNAHAIAREKWRVAALFEAKNTFEDQNFHPAPYLYNRPDDQVMDIDLENDDILAKLYGAKKLVSDRKQKTLAFWLLSNDSIFKLQNNESLRLALFGTEDRNVRRLTREELDQVLRIVGITLIPIEDEQGNNYHYTDRHGAQKLFVPLEDSLLIPNVQLGNTVLGETAEEIVLGREGYRLTNNNGVVMFPKYEPTPVHFELNSVSRFTVVLPKSDCTFKVHDTSDPISTIALTTKGKAVAKK